MIEYKKNHQAYFILNVTDLQKAKQFYADIFGFEVLFDYKKADLKSIGENDRGNKVEIDGSNKHSEPYDLLLMSLGSCLYATFEDIISKKKLSYEKLIMDITGEKRTETPTTLKYCSIYNTLAHVAEMHSEMEFF